VVVTAEVKHSVARWAEDAGLWLLDAGHFATEYPAMRVLSDLLRRHCADQGWPLAIDTAEQHPPLRLA
jgi:putative NIF3 family GTP cyclohydrolase 1 type 2